MWYIPRVEMWGGGGGFCGTYLYGVLGVIGGWRNLARGVEVVLGVGGLLWYLAKESKREQEGKWGGSAVPGSRVIEGNR